jgi:predicted ATPase
MKISAISFENHPILGSIYFNFCDENENAIDTIIIAGENGTGKSILLNEIYHTLQNNSIVLGQNYNKTITYQLDENEQEKISRFVGVEINKFVGILYRHDNQSWDFEFRFKNRHNNLITITRTYPTYHLFRDALLGQNIMQLRAVFSDVEINFTPQGIGSTTGRTLDVSDIRFERSSGNLSTEIAQLLVDIDSQDSRELMQWVDANPNAVPPEEVKHTRIKRFSSAFHYIFPAKKFVGVKDFNGAKDIIFKEYDKEISIANLSTGEKQIVFRGSFLLKNQRSNKGAVILIDEPEISLHPDWQVKILNYFKTLFTDDNGIQTSQLFVVTHSPFIIHNNNRSNDKVIIMKKDEKGNVVISDHPKFYSWSGEEAVKEAFNIGFFTNEEKPLVFVEGETDEKYINKTLEVFGIQTEAKFEWIGRNHEQGPEFTGDKSLNQAASFLKANPIFIKNKIVLLYDNDTDRKEENHGDLLIRIMPKPPAVTIYKKGIESLLVIPEGFDSEAYYSSREKADDYGAKSIISELNKTKLCSYICDELEPEQQKAVLGNIKDYIDHLIAELGK